MSSILIKFSTGNPAVDWECKQSHIPMIGAIVGEPGGNGRNHRVTDHVWPAISVNNYVTLHVSEIVEAIAEPEAETEAKNETV